MHYLEIPVFLSQTFFILCNALADCDENAEAFFVGKLVQI